jgi:Fic family protein
MHPFLDGNGRVARLMSHAMLLGILDTGAFWSVARGLARKVQECKTLLANCDARRWNDLDGRGTLSEEALAEFTRFFLRVCIDEVAFMETLVQPDRLRARVLFGPKRKSEPASFLRRRGGSSKRSSTEARSRVATST